jgi:hypothetical protein
MPLVAQAFGVTFCRILGTLPLSGLEDSNAGVCLSRKWFDRNYFKPFKTFLKFSL